MAVEQGKLWRTGMDANRRKGESLSEVFDAVNCRLTDARRWQKRECLKFVGTLDVKCKGLFGYNGLLYSFSHLPVADQVFGTVIVRTKVCRHPSSNEVALAKVWYAQVFLRRLYVVAEFADGLIRHYWLEEPNIWTANTVLSYSARVMPTTGDNGYYYQIIIPSTDVAWQANKVYGKFNYVQPTVYNAFRYEATGAIGWWSTAGAPSGDVEPTWPAIEGATVEEFRQLTAPPSTNTPPPPPAPPAPPPGNRPGGGFGGPDFDEYRNGVGFGNEEP